MQKLHYSININAPKEKVWKTMLEDKTYREWTEVFNPEGGSYFEGSWEEGSNIRFVGPDKEGNLRGMISKIAESRPYDFVSIQHLGEFNKDQEKIYPPESKAFENYTFNDKDGGTEVLVDLVSPKDFPKEYEIMFEEMWPKGLAKLKEISEKKYANKQGK